MTDRYFMRFPNTVYSNTIVTDLTRRVKIADVSKEVPNLFYPVTLNSGMRPDTLAYSYYNDSELDWMIYLSNEIVDPYYQWYIGEEDFNSYITDKYGSYDLSRKLIKFWRNNWANDDTELTPAFYNNTLALDQRQYYGPKYGAGAKIVSYSRKKDDQTTNTNKVIQYAITYTTGNAYSNGEVLDIKVSGEIVGGAQVIVSNSTVLIVEHVTGNSSANSTWSKTLLGETSETQATSVLSTILHENITNATAAFWSSVTFYDWEVEMNERRKHIFVMNPSAVQTVSNEITDLLQE